MNGTQPIDSRLLRHAGDPVREARREQYKRAMADALAIGASRERRPAEAAQSTVPRIEHDEDLYLSTLREYVEALGGRLEINAVFPDQTIALVPGSAGS